MVQFNFTYDPGISLEQRIGFELAAQIWSSYLTDDITVNLHIVSTDHIEGNAIGGAIPLFHEQHYGVFTEYLEQDATPSSEGEEEAGWQGEVSNWIDENVEDDATDWLSQAANWFNDNILKDDEEQPQSVDEQVIDSLQEGNTVDVLVNGEVVDGNTQIMLTSAQAKALGMDEAITLDNGTTWNRDLVVPDALDGYIVINQSYDWNYDFLREGAAPESTLDFLSLALHEIGHQLGFVSGLDGLLDINQLHSGETQIGGITALDLFRHTVDSTGIENPDGAVSDLTIGANAYFSVDGGTTNLGLFSTGQGGDGFQAAHWKRMKDAMGIFDPTLAYQERLSLTELDLQAIDALGYDVNYDALGGLDMDALLLEAEMAVADQLGLDSSVLASASSEGNNLYEMGYDQWWQIFEAQILELGYGNWWQLLELGYGLWFQENELLELDYGTWFQYFEEQLLELGYGTWFQEFESSMLELGYGNWWQLLELGYGNWWQELETFFSTLDTVYNEDPNVLVETVDSGVGGSETTIYEGGNNDDIFGGSEKQDRISGGQGDDLIDGEAGHDVLWGDQGRDLLYGYTGNDIIYGGKDDDFIMGEVGDDKLYG
ncbi:MAG: NF038122 family metalloprotease, partial [Cyanobacteria bacterium J06632_3]